MTKRNVFILAVFLMVAWVLASPATAGTKQTGALTGSFGRQVNYYDFHYNQYDKPFGEWQPVTVTSSKNPNRTCFMSGKWGNLFDDGFSQDKTVGGNGCYWGGTRLAYFWDAPGTANDSVQWLFYNQDHAGQPGDYCVATTTTPQVYQCSQLSDGSIFLQHAAPPAGVTLHILQAEFIVCVEYTVGQSTVDCNHDYYAIQF